MRRQSTKALAVGAVPSPASVVADEHSLAVWFAQPLPVFSTRGIKTFDQRSMKILSKPDEFKFYQRMSSDPLKASGVQFLTHFSHHHRMHAKGREALVDYLHWGKTNGQAWSPHRFQRVAFDFSDSVHPTKVPSGLGGAGAGGARAGGVWLGEQERAAADGPKSDNRDNASSSFNPHEFVWSAPVHANARFTRRHPQEAHTYFPSNFPSSSLLQDYVRNHGVTAPTPAEFGFDETLDKFNGGLPGQAVPGITAPYLGEPDTCFMEAMAVPALRDGSLADPNSVCVNIGRYSKSVYINVPDRDNVLRGPVARDLAAVLDMHTNGMRTKLVVLKAAQSGKTDAFCSGIDTEELAHNLRMRDKALAAAAALEQQKNAILSFSHSHSLAVKNIDAAIRRLQVEAEDYLLGTDRALRDGFCLLWRVFSAQRPLMTIVNGTCRNIGNGIALLPKYAALRDSTELSHDGPQQALTPFGGLTHLLARTETTLKYPGLAEFVMLTGAPLYAGDALRLGWSDLFSTLPDLDRHIRTWFDDTEHMHNDAVAWQLGHLLETCFQGKNSGSTGGASSSNNPGDGHESTTGMERCALTPQRARWVEDAFADQPSVEGILATLGEMEKLPLTDANNTTDVNFARIVVAGSDAAAGRAGINSMLVETAIEKLRKTKMHFSLTPWDVTEPPVDVPVVSVGEIFRDYFFEQSPVVSAAASAADGASASGINVAARHDTARLVAWRKFREREFEAFQRHRAAVHPRHVFVRVSGCESHLLADFEHDFESSGAENLQMPLGDDGAASSPDALLAGTKMLRALKRTVLRRLGMPETRDVDLQWSLPTLDNAVVRNDTELLQLLHADPGLDDPRRPTRHPPVYFTVVRRELHLSEWAYSVKHQLLLSSPTALKASLALLRAVRGADGTEEQVRSVSESLALEFRYATRMMARREFAAVGAPSTWAPSKWAQIRARQADEEADAAKSGNAESLDHTLFPTTPNVNYEEVFERNVVIDGHRFPLRPRWAPRTVAEVDDAAVAALGEPLSFAQDRVTELNAPTETNMGRRISETVFDHLGYEVVPGLGEHAQQQQQSEGKSGKTAAVAASAPAVQPLKSDAYVPNNINFYEMARHPWEDTPTSWRSNGFTEGSLHYFNKKYAEAVKKVHDPENRGAHEYWPSRYAVGGNNNSSNNNSNAGRKRNNNKKGGDDAAAGELEPEEVLLRDRFWGAVQRAETEVEGWARDARAMATGGKFDYELEPTMPDEKIYDDEYYRWFIRVGHHPNPSGILRGGVGAAPSGKKKAANENAGGGDQ